MHALARPRCACSSTDQALKARPPILVPAISKNEIERLHSARSLRCEQALSLYVDALK